MSKTKQKTHNELEHLRGIVRQQKSIIRNLKKRLKELERREYYYDNKDILDEEDKHIETEQIGDCPQCGKGTLSESDLFFLVIKKCDHCDYEEKTKKEKEERQEGS